MHDIEAKDPNALELIAVLIPLSQAYGSDDQLKDAQDNAERAVKISELTPLHTKGFIERGFKPERIIIVGQKLKIDALEQLGACLAEQQRDTEAEPLLQRVVAMRGDNNAESAYTLSMLAEIAQRRADYESAEKLFKRAIGLRETESELNSPEALADAFQDLGNFYYLREDYKHAEELYRKAFALLRKNDMTATVVYGKLYGDLADIYEKRGQLSEAEKAIRQELRVFLDAKFSDVSVPLGKSC